MKVTYKDFCHTARVNMIAAVEDFCDRYDMVAPALLEEMATDHASAVIRRAKEKLFGKEREVDIPDKETIVRAFREASSEAEYTHPLTDIEGIGVILFLAITMMDANIAIGIINDIFKEEEE